jgi:AcrR family transcriptional regulator
MSANTGSTAKSLAPADKVRKPHASTAATRERILTAAMSVFANRGYNNGSLLEIADRVGMTHAGVLHYFGSKDNLLTAVLERRDESGIDTLEGHRLPTGGALLQHLVNTARGNTERVGIVQAYAVLSVESVTENHPAQQFFRDRFSGLRTIVADALREVVPPTVPEHELVRAASLIIAMMDGLQVQWLLDPDTIDMASSVEIAINGVVAQLRAGTTAT